MDVLQQLAMALGLSTLAGINLYLTVFVTGLAINQQWIALAPQYEALAVLGHPLVIVLAGVFYFVEFFADKVPWVDSAWDAVHTAIRPIGAALLSIQVLGEPTGLMMVVAGLLGGSVALTTHSAKSATRLLVNTSPEPFSNIAVSTAEDLAVIGGLSLLYLNPAIGIGVCLAVVLGTLWFFPKIWRSSKITLFLLFRKIKMVGNDRHVPLAELRLPARYESLFGRMNPQLQHLTWCAPVIARRGPGLPRNVHGYLGPSEEDPDHLYFMTKSGFTPVLRTLDLNGAKVRHETRFLIEEIHLFTLHDKRHYIFGMDRTCHLLAEETVKAIQSRLNQLPSGSQPLQIEAGTPEVLAPDDEQG